MNSKRASLFLFLLGTFSMTQIHVVGNIGISELVVFFVAPLIFIQDYRFLKLDGFMPAIMLSILMCVGCVVASIMNHTSVPNFLRGFAAPYTIFSVLVVGHHLVRKSPGGHKWFALGMAMTVTINIFIFQRGVEADIWGQGGRGLEAVEGIMNGPLFWVSRINAWINVPIRGWYLQSPSIYSIAMPIFMFFFAALTTESGRSAAATALGAAMLVLLGGKKRKQLDRLSRGLWGVVIVSLIIIQFLTMAYKSAATSGLLGEKAYHKYERQMKGRKGGVLATLIGGRLEFFVGTYAALKKPIVGYGPWALDVYGYYDEFLAKYGTADDYVEYLRAQAYQQKVGHSFVRLLGAHSHIIGSWLKYGICGLLFWLYVLWLVFRYFRKDLSAVPQWFGLLAVSTPSFLWSVMFSPFGDRVWETMLIVFMLMAHAVRIGRIHLPFEMIKEIEKVDH